MIIAPASLAEHLHDPHWLVVDCRFDLDDPARGEREYTDAHVPGAVYVHLARDLSGAKTGRNGRHPLPTVEEMAQRFGRLGIGDDTQVVAYDAEMGAYASRLWWMLRYLGHDAVAVLDGGFARWVAEGRPVEALAKPDVPPTGARRSVPLHDGGEARPKPQESQGTTGAPSPWREPRVFTPRVRPEMLVTVDELARMLSEPRRPAARPAPAPYHVLIDARSPERYRGEVEPIDRVPGHIPGAINRHYLRNLGPDGMLRAPEELRREFLALLGDTPGERVIAYCGSGVTACHNLLAMELAGIHGARLYVGSWSEWSADPERPVDTGDMGQG